MLGLEFENNEVVTTDEGDAWPKLTSTLANRDLGAVLGRCSADVDAAVSPAVPPPHP